MKKRYELNKEKRIALAKDYYRANFQYIQARKKSTYIPKIREFVSNPVLGCGHPDVMDNLYWIKAKTIHDGVLFLGGNWRCKTCSLNQSRAYSKTENGKRLYRAASKRYRATEAGKETLKRIKRKYRDSIKGIKTEELYNIKRLAEMRGNYR